MDSALDATCARQKIWLVIMKWRISGGIFTKLFNEELKMTA